MDTKNLYGTDIKIVKDVVMKIDRHTTSNVSFTMFIYAYVCKFIMRWDFNTGEEVI